MSLINTTGIYLDDIVEYVPSGIRFKGQVNNPNGLPSVGNNGDYYLVRNDLEGNPWNGRYVFLEEYEESENVWVRIENQAQVSTLAAVSVPNTQETHEYVVAFSGNGIPVNPTGAKVGDIYRDSGTNILYQCTSVSGSSSSWTKVSYGNGVNSIFKGTFRIIPTNPTSNSDNNLIISTEEYNPFLSNDSSIFDNIIVGENNSIGNEDFTARVFYNLSIFGSGNTINADGSSIYDLHLLGNGNEIHSSTFGASLLVCDGSSIYNCYPSFIMGDNIHVNERYFEEITTYFNDEKFIFGNDISVNFWYTNQGVIILGHRNTINSLYDADNYATLDCAVIGGLNKVDTVLNRNNNSLFIFGQGNGAGETLKNVHLIIGDSNNLNGTEMCFGDQNTGKKCKLIMGFYNNIGNCTYEEYGEILARGVVVGNENRGTTVAPENVTIFGEKNSFTGTCSDDYVFGNNNTISNNNHYIYGCDNVFNSGSSLITLFGNNNSFLGCASLTIFGSNNTFDYGGSGSIIMGCGNTITSANSIIVIGTNNTISSGGNIKCFGSNNEVQNGSSAFGFGLVGNANTFVMGAYNSVDPSKKFIFGCGTGTTNRYNLFTVDYNNNTMFSGTVNAQNIPTPPTPTEDGTYQLQCAVTVTTTVTPAEEEGGTPTTTYTYDYSYSWVLINN